MTPEFGVKVLTHDYRPPIRGGYPIWDGETIPFELPKAKLDTSNDDCGAGWNYTDQLAEAITIAGMWPDGSPACCVYVRASDDRIRRRNKLRCSQLTIVARVEPDEIRAAIAALSCKWFAGEHAERMSASQWDWYQALGRPDIDEIAVAIDLQAALEARALDGWTLRRYDNVGAGWDAWAARVAWDAWDAWAAWAAWAAWDARDALIVEYASLQGWIEHDALLLTTGIRDAYSHGLAIAVPVERNVLGWAAL